MLSFLALRLYKTEDVIVRKVVKYPKLERKNSFPFLSCDTYALLSDHVIDSEGDLISLDITSNNQTLYINGVILPELGDSILEVFSNRKFYFNRIMIGDTDKPPCDTFLRELGNHCDKILSVNIRHTQPKVLPLPLGLESQRFRSAGQLRDFTKRPNLKLLHRRIGILVAWNDSTNRLERESARMELRKSQISHEIVERVPARYVHLLMRQSLFVACPPGNGQDTHRFWEALYLGAVPMILEEHQIDAFKDWPHITLKNWNFLEFMKREELERLYLDKVAELSNFRYSAKLFLGSISGEFEDRIRK